jgi:hypothetical protein
MYCDKCGNLAEDIMLDSLEVLMAELYCTSCVQQTVHNARCDGGSNFRFRANDWPEYHTDPGWYRKQIKAGRVTATEDDKPVRRFRSNEILHDKPKYINGTDEREQRREVKQYGTNRKYGKTPIFVDMKRGNTCNGG